MARVNKVEACMICEQMPCVCFARAKPAPKPRVVKPTASKPQTEAPRSIAGALTEAAQKAEEARIPVDKELTPAEAMEIPEIVQAIQNLTPLLHRSEKIKYEPILGLHLRTRLERWRASLRSDRRAPISPAKDNR